MSQAKEMVQLSKKITDKLRDKGLAEDEVSPFRVTILVYLDDSVESESIIVRSGRPSD